MKYPIFTKWLWFVIGSAIFFSFGPLYAERIEDFDMDSAEKKFEVLARQGYCFDTGSFLHHLSPSMPEYING
jgi:hypothetical protein